MSPAVRGNVEVFPTAEELTVAAAEPSAPRWSARPRRKYFDIAAHGGTRRNSSLTRVSTRPSACPTSTRSAVPRKSPVSTTPGIARSSVSSARAARASASGAGSAQSNVRFPFSFTSRAAVSIHSHLRIEPRMPDRARTGPSANGITSTGTQSVRRAVSRASRRRRESPGASTRRRRYARAQRAAMPFDQIEIRRDFVRAVDRDIERFRFGERDERNTDFARERGDGARRRHAGHAKPARTRSPSRRMNADAVRPEPSPTRAPSRSVRAAARRDRVDRRIDPVLMRPVRARGTRSARS